MGKMYGRSFVMIMQAKDALKKISEDDAYLDIACFETQQAVEFLIKEILTEKGVPYPKSHDISYLLSLAKETGFTFDGMDTLELLSSTVTDWEESSRYGKGVRTSADTVRRIHGLYNNMNSAFLEMQERNQNDTAN